METEDARDNAFARLYQARDDMRAEADNGNSSRELSIALTHCETAMLWLKKDQEMRPPTDESSND